MEQNEGQRVLGVVTARGGSKGIPGKNIKQLGSMPLIEYTLSVANKSELLTRTIVSTDDLKIAEVAKNYGADVPFIRPFELAGDDVPHVPVLQHALSHVEKTEDVIYDYVVILQPTSPFRLPEDIDKTIDKIQQTGADSAVTLVEMSGDNHPTKAKSLTDGRVEAYMLEEKEGVRRQDLPIAYRRSGAVYVIRRDVLMSGRLYGDYIVGVVVPKERSIDIDEPVDWARAEFMLKDLLEKGYRW